MSGATVLFDQQALLGILSSIVVVIGSSLAGVSVSSKEESNYSH